MYMIYHEPRQPMRQDLLLGSTAGCPPWYQCRFQFPMDLTPTSHSVHSCACSICHRTWRSGVLPAGQHCHQQVPKKLSFGQLDSTERGMGNQQRYQKVLFLLILNYALSLPSALLWVKYYMRDRHFQSPIYSAFFYTEIEGEINAERNLYIFPQKILQYLLKGSDNKVRWFSKINIITMEETTFL